MKIRRKVNGIPVEFELTIGEMESIWWECQKEIDRQAVESWLDDISEKDVRDDFGVEKEMFRSELLSEAADALSVWAQDERDEYVTDHIEDAVRETIEECGEDE